MRELPSQAISTRQQFRPLVAGVIMLVLLLLAVPALAARGGGKGGGKGGKGSAPQPELHHQWRLLLNGPYSAVRPVLGSDGTIYVVDVHGYLYAVSPDGTLQWSVVDAGGKGVDVGPDGTIYTGNENFVKAFRPDGSLKWTFTQTPRAFVFIDVAVGPDGNIYGIGSSGMGVFSLADAPDGPVLRWTNPEAYTRTFVGYAEIEFGPTSDGQDHQLYFYANGHIRAVRLSDGASVFSASGNTRPRVSDYDGTWHRPADAFDPDGSLVWHFDYPPATGGTEPVLAPDGTHYSVNSGLHLYAIDPFGNQEWTHTYDEFINTPEVDPAESMVLLSTSGTSTHAPALRAVSSSNGGDLWRMEFPLDETGASQFVDSDFAFSADGTIAYMTTFIAGSNSRSYLNAVAIDPALPNASTILRSTDIAVDGRSRKGVINATGDVTIQDQNRSSVSGATVHATWTLPDGSTVDQIATVSGGGIARFNVSGTAGMYRLTVTNIVQTGFTYDPNRSILSGLGYIF